MMCIDVGATPASLEVGKVYRVLRTEDVARRAKMVRVIDDSGEDYLYRVEQFVPVRLPLAAKRAILQASATGA